MRAGIAAPAAGARVGIPPAALAPTSAPLGSVSLAVSLPLLTPGLTSAPRAVLPNVETRPVAVAAPLAAEALLPGVGPRPVAVPGASSVVPKVAEGSAVPGERPVLGALSGVSAAAAKPAASAAALRTVYDAGPAFKRAGQEPVVDLSDTKSVYRGFLRRLGFHSYTADIAQSRAERAPVQHQAQVFDVAADRLKVLDASRELAVAVMAGLERQGYSEESVERAVDLAARLIELRPLEAPSNMPYSVRTAKRPERLRWLLGVTRDKASSQAGRVLSDVAGTVYSPAELVPREELQALLGHVRAVLSSMYADVEYGAGRYAGRALVSSLARHARLFGRPELEARLASALAERGFKLSDYIGSRFELTDRSGNKEAFEVRTGDILGTRSRSRRSSEIAIGAVPHPSRWWHAWREGLFGSILGVFMKPLEKYPVQVAGQPVRNWVRRSVHEWRKWLANTSHFLKGYSHAAIADVREADGIYNVLVWENEVDQGEGGIRPVSFWDQFLAKDYHARFGYARWDPFKVWDAFHAQAAERGWQEFPHRVEDGAWRTVLSREEHEALLAIPRERAGELVDTMNRRTMRLIEALMTGFGIGYGYGLSNSLLRLICTTTLWHGFLVGSQFEMQSKPDMFHPLTYLFKWLGTKNTAGLDMAARMIWPGSLFADDKVAEHRSIDLAGRDGARRADDNTMMQVYAERDPALTERLREVLKDGVADPFAFQDGTLETALHRQLVVRRWRRRDPEGKRAGVSLPRGYQREIEILYDR
ncbi:MAG: hypothetical protein HYZ75_05640 [Elusimicrobia bacterium]|nr:hypothetical protein [Elusimicrobiota bacterium]